MEKIPKETIERINRYFINFLNGEGIEYLWGFQETLNTLLELKVINYMRWSRLSKASEIALEIVYSNLKEVN